MYKVYGAASYYSVIIVTPQSQRITIEMTYGHPLLSLSFKHSCAWDMGL